MKYDIPRLRRKMLSKGWTVLELSRRSTVPESTLRGLFQRNSAHPDTIKAAARPLGFSLDELVIEGRNGAKPSEQRTA